LALPPGGEDKGHPAPRARAALNDNALRDLIEAKLNIKRAVGAAFILAAVSSVLGLLSLFGYRAFGASAFTLVHGGIVLGLGYGIHHYSRTCAVIMFLYYLADTVYSWVSSGEVAGIIVFAVILYFFGRGAHATFIYHSLSKGKP
jgi:hypothetical protein